MKKIISLFQRNYEGDRLVRNEVTPGAEWVINGEGIATQKYDGTCCMIRGGKLYKRCEVKPGNNPPPDFEPANEVDEVTGKQQGWLPVGEGKEDQWHGEAFANWISIPWICHIDGWTYELCGPKINGNPENCDVHLLFPHAYSRLLWWPRTFEGIKNAFQDPVCNLEGVVWWRNLEDPNCDKVKIKMKDFGLKRGKK